jgi:hypothetical protein
MFNPLPSKFVDNGFENLQIFANYVLDRTTDYGRTLGEFVLRVLPQYPKCLAAANCRFQPLTHCNANAKQGKKVNKQGNAFFKHNNSSVATVTCKITLLLSQDVPACPLFYPV